jgi:ribonuclease HI
MNRVTCHFDGGCEPINPGGQATYGAIVRDENGTKLFEESGYVGQGRQMSNNVAEYEGIIAVMKFLIANDLREGIIYGDSLLVVKQLNRKWKAKRGLYLKHYKHAARLRQQLPKIQIIWIPRIQNTEADYLARQAVRETLTTTARKRELIHLIRQQKADHRETERRMMDKIFL